MHVIFVNGTYGVGKSSTLDAMGDRLAAAGAPFALMDIDWFHRSWPTAPDDGANTRIEAANLAAVWANYRSAGPRLPIISGVLATAADRARYQGALGLPIRSVRLDATDETIDLRLRRRYPDERRVALDWHLQRYAALKAQLARADLDEAVIETTHFTPGEVAEAVLAHFGH